jgi:hypothetical protein
MADDLLAELDAENSGEVVDLLDTLTDAGAPAWVPDEAGEGVQGKVTSVSDQADEYNEGQRVPIVTIEMSDGEKVRVIGFSSVLRREIADANPEPGDTFAVKYFGERELTKGKFAGKPYKLFRVAVKKAA